MVKYSKSNVHELWRSLKKYEKVYAMRCVELLKRKFMLLLTALLLPWCSAQAGGRILFIPHDDRPISCHQTVEVVEAAGYELVLPPKEFLSNATNMGHPQELWQWLRKNAPKAKSAVIASDSMLYGGLIPSRKHEVSQAEMTERLENFKRLR